VLEAVGVKGAHGFKVLHTNHHPHHAVVLEYAHWFALRPIQEFAESRFSLISGKSLHTIFLEDQYRLIYPKRSIWSTGKMG
jgi:hypothetical protein